VPVFARRWNKQQSQKNSAFLEEKPSSEAAAVHQVAGGKHCRKKWREEESRHTEPKKNGDQATLAVRRKWKRDDAKKTTSGTKRKETNVKTGKKDKMDKNAMEETAAVVCDPPGEMLLDDELTEEGTEEEGDEEFPGEEWELVGHAVDGHNRNLKFKVHNGRRKDKRCKCLWGACEELKKDGVVGMEVFIRTSSAHCFAATRKEKEMLPAQKRTVVVVRTNQLQPWGLIKSPTLRNGMPPVAARLATCMVQSLEMGVGPLLQQGPQNKRKKCKASSLPAGVCPSAALSMHKTRMLLLVTRLRVVAWFALGVGNKRASLPCLMRTPPCAGNQATGSEMEHSRNEKIAGTARMKHCRNDQNNIQKK
jgi:hypothetical protein